MPISVLESLVMTRTFSIQLSDSAVSIVDKDWETGGVTHDLHRLEEMP